MKKIRVFILLLFSISLVYSQDSTRIKKREYYPHYAHLQYAGNMGFLSIGAGYRFEKMRMGVALQFGYLLVVQNYGLVH